MAVRATILDTIASQLATITTANGYASNVVPTILREVVHSDEVNEAQRVTLAMEDLAEIEKLGRFRDGTILGRFRVLVRCYLTSADHLDVPTDEVGRILADIERLVETRPHALGSNVRYWETLDTQNEGIGASQGFVDVIIQITYKYPIGAP